MTFGAGNKGCPDVNLDQLRKILDQQEGKPVPPDERKHYVLAHTPQQFDVYRGKGAFPKNAIRVKHARNLRGAPRGSVLHMLPEWWRHYDMGQALDIDYMIKEGFFEVEEYPELEFS